MSSARKRAYKHKAYAEIDSLKQELMLKSHHYDTMLVINQALAKKGDEMKAELDAFESDVDTLAQHNIELQQKCNAQSEEITKYKALCEKSALTGRQ